MNSGFLKLVQKVFGYNMVKFNGGNVFLWNIPVIIIPVSVFSTLYSTSSTNSDRLKQLFFSVGRIQGEYSTKILMERFKLKANLKNYSFFVAQTELVGIGKIELYDFNEQTKEYNFRIISSPFDDAPDKESVGLTYVKGTICGGMEQFFKSKNLENSHAVIVNNDNNIKEFSIKASSIPFEYKYELDILKDKDLSLLILSKNISRIPVEIPEIEKTSKLFSRNIKYKNQYLVYNNEKCLIITSGIFSLILHFLPKISTNPKVLYEAGKKFGAILFDHGRSKLKKIETLQTIISAISYYGFGIAKVIRIRDPILIRLQNNTLSQSEKYLFGSKTTFDQFYAGLISEIASRFFQKKINFAKKEKRTTEPNSCYFRSI